MQGLGCPQSALDRFFYFSSKFERSYKMAENEGNINQGDQTNTNQGGDGGSGGVPAWTAQLPASLKENPAFTSFKTIGDLGTTFLETTGKVKDFESKVKEHEDKVKALEGKIGAEYIPKLKKDATEAEKQAYYKAIGRPDKVDEYQFEPVKLPAGAEKFYDPTIDQWFKDRAFQLGLSKEQAAALHKEYAASFVDRFNKTQAAAEEIRQKATTDLKTKWGNKFDENVLIAERGIEHFKIDGFRDILDASGLKNDTRMIEFLYEVGNAIQGDKIILGQQANIQEAREPGKMRYPSMEANA
jgi:hypothetical protein